MSIFSMVFIITLYFLKLIEILLNLRTMETFTVVILRRLSLFLLMNMPILNI
uniref:Uncharacterized protein n=1 Tax=Podoviridae sp. ct8Lf7 TaxID=2827723 RepID=A0A8S5S0I9_9CAUD|nr:MAG TPA: hypothetical protein [Podoviridae sp. ct8Lf7]